MDSHPPIPPNRPLNILLAEDNELNQFLINSVVSDWNMNIHIAANGKEALDLLEKEPFDLILMDMQMPEMDGFEAIQKIRAMASAKASLPIISLTAGDSEKEVAKCLAAGASAHVSKPFDPDELLHTIKKLTSRENDKEQMPE